jgi:hypothetical protein
MAVMGLLYLYLLPYTMNIAYECSGVLYLILSEMCTQNLRPFTCHLSPVLTRIKH